MTAWIPLIVSAVETAIRIGKEHGLPAPGAAELERIRKEVDAVAARLLPLELAALVAHTIAAAAAISAKIDELPAVEHCPNDGEVLTIHNGPAGRHVSCSKCGYRR